jgi:hypothetical protein
VDPKKVNVSCTGLSPSRLGITRSGCRPLHYLTVCAWVALRSLSNSAAEPHYFQGGAYATPSPPNRDFTLLHRKTHPFSFVHLFPSGRTHHSRPTESRHYLTRESFGTRLILRGPSSSLVCPAKLRVIKARGFSTNAGPLSSSCKRGAALQITRSITLKSLPIVIRHSRSGSGIAAVRCPFFLLSSPYLALRRTSSPFASLEA